MTATWRAGRVGSLWLAGSDSQSSKQFFGLDAASLIRKTYYPRSVRCGWHREDISGLYQTRPQTYVIITQLNSLPATEIVPDLRSLVSQLAGLFRNPSLREQGQTVNEK